jgi:hypothetical protein
VRHASGLEDQVAWPGDADRLVNLDADLALQDEGVLVLALVRVHRGGQDAGSDRVFDQGEGPPL